MTTLYRAVWDEPEAGPDTTELLGSARDIFRRWADPDGSGQNSGDGEWTLATPPPNHGQRTVTIREHAVDDAHGFTATAQDDDSGPSGLTRWSTSFSYMFDASGGHAWIETQHESDDIGDFIKVGRPRFVSTLLERPGLHVLDGSILTDQVQSYSATKVHLLVQTLRNPRRSLPFIVFSEPTYINHDWRSIARSVASRSEGTAITVVLDNNGTDELRRLMGDLAVWDGAVRFYNPSRLEGPSDGFRHQYYRAERIAQGPGGIVDRLAWSAAMQSVRRRVPPPIERFARSAVSAETQQIRDLDDRWRLELEIQAEEQQETVRELARAQAHLDRIRQRLTSHGEEALFWEASVPAPDAPPETVQDTSDAVTAARLYFSDELSIPEGVEQDLDRIDTAPNAYAWANTALRGLKALAAYCRAKHDGFNAGFWEWCVEGDAEAWPATTKKLAMRESESVMSNEKMLKARRFPVSTDLEKSGTQVMQAHLKISEGGGSLAPRIYFSDDAAGVTGKIHVGFVGPHYLVPNTKS